MNFISHSHDEQLECIYRIPSFKEFILNDGHKDFCGSVLYTSKNKRDIDDIKTIVKEMTNPFFYTLPAYSYVEGEYALIARVSLKQKKKEKSALDIVKAIQKSISEIANYLASASLPPHVFCLNISKQSFTLKCETVEEIDKFKDIFRVLPSTLTIDVACSKKYGSVMKITSKARKLPNLFRLILNAMQKYYRLPKQPSSEIADLRPVVFFPSLITSPSVKDSVNRVKVQNCIKKL